MEEMDLAEQLRRCIREAPTINAVAKATGVAQSTLQEFAMGRQDGSFPDLRLSNAQRLIDHFGKNPEFQISTRIRKRSRRMILKDELAACGVAESADEFKRRLIETMTRQYEGRSIDGLVLEPDDSREYCNEIRRQLVSNDIHDAVILKALMNIRRQKNAPTGLSAAGPRKNYAKGLREAGCDMEAKEFKEFVFDSVPAMYKEQNVDGLLCHPIEAKSFCRFVRARLGCDKLTDNFILSAMMAERKASTV